MNTPLQNLASNLIVNAANHTDEGLIAVARDTLAKMGKALLGLLIMISGRNSHAA